MNIRTFIDRPILSGVISVLILIVGLIALLQLPLERFPDIAPPTVNVISRFTGASAETTQKSVVVPLEESINGVEHMLYMTSKASNEVNTYKYYTSIEVQKGDTLWTIAQQYADDDADYASYIEEVKEMNQLTSDTIHAGEYLTVSYSSNEFK